MTQNTLTSSLIKASEGNKDDIAKFFEALIEAVLYIPLKTSSTKLKEIPTIGEQSLENLPYLVVNDEEEEMKLIPVFSEEPFLHEWAERKINVSEEDIKNFLWKIPDGTWLYLNPNQEVGKEISPWEIELLKSGKDAIPDLVDGVLETEQEEFEIEVPSEELQKVCTPLLPVLEVYPELQQAYLLSIKEVQSSSPRALIGLKFLEPFPDDKREYIRSEVERTACEHLDKPFTGVFIVDDLGLEDSPNHTLFLDVAPFYSTLS